MPGASQQPHPAACAPLKGVILMKSNRKTIVLLPIVGILALLVVIGWVIHIAREKIMQASVDSFEEQEVDGSDTEVDKILLDTGDGQMWIPVLADVPACTRVPEQHVLRNGEVFYLENNQITSKIGIDVSAYQGNIDWQTVREAGVEFAFIRCAYRGYESGEMVVDANYYTNMQGALDAGIQVGVYFYSQAITPEEAVEEAELALSMIEGYDVTYPIVYDWEVVSESTARTNGISVEDLTACNIAFCERIKQAGYTPMIYQNKQTSLLRLDLPALKEYDFWLAEYNEEAMASYYYDYRIWQYCSDGTLPGITGTVDMDICFEPYA